MVPSKVSQEPYLSHLTSRSVVGPSPRVSGGGRRESFRGRPLDVQQPLGVGGKEGGPGGVCFALFPTSSTSGRFHGTGKGTKVFFLIVGLGGKKNFLAVQRRGTGGRSPAIPRHGGTRL